MKAKTLVIFYHSLRVSFFFFLGIACVSNHERSNGLDEEFLENWINYIVDSDTNCKDAEFYLGVRGKRKLIKCLDSLFQNVDLKKLEIQCSRKIRRNMDTEISPIIVIDILGNESIYFGCAYKTLTDKISLFSVAKNDFEFIKDRGSFAKLDKYYINVSYSKFVSINDEWVIEADRNFCN